MLRSLFKSRPSRATAETLYALAADQARTPAFYTRLGVADRIDARFELYTLHVLLLVLRLRHEGDQGAETAQALFDTYVSSLDDTLRELGVGDMAVAKKMRKLGEALYGRMQAYEAAIVEADEAALSAALARNVYESEDPAAGAALARYALDSRARLADQPAATLAAGPNWGEIG